MDLKQIISDVIDNVSYKTANGMVDLRDAYHLHEVQMELKKHIDPALVEAVLYEKDKENQPLDDKEKEKAKSQRLVHLGGGAYGKKGQDATHRNVDGKLVAIEKGDDKKDDKGSVFNDKEKDSDDVVRNKDYDPKNADWQPEGGNQEKAVKRTADKLRAITGQIPVESESEEKAINNVINTIESGSTPNPEDVKVFNKYIRIKETGGQSSPEFAFYVSNTTAGEFMQGRRLKVELGTGQNGHMVRRKLEAQGIQAASASTTSGKVPPKLSGKIMTMTKIAQDKGGGIIEHKVKKTKNADGQIESVTVGGRTIKRIPEPDRKEFIISWNSSGRYQAPICWRKKISTVSCPFNNLRETSINGLIALTPSFGVKVS